MQKIKVKHGPKWALVEKRASLTRVLRKSYESAHVVKVQNGAGTTRTWKALETLAKGVFLMIRLMI